MRDAAPSPLLISTARRAEKATTPRKSRRSAPAGCPVRQCAPPSSVRSQTPPVPLAHATARFTTASPRSEACVLLTSVCQRGGLAAIAAAASPSAAAAARAPHRRRRRGSPRLSASLRAAGVTGRLLRCAAAGGLGPRGGLGGENMRLRALETAPLMRAVAERLVRRLPAAAERERGLLDVHLLPVRIDDRDRALDKVGAVAANRDFGHQLEFSFGGWPPATSMSVGLAAAGSSDNKLRGPVRITPMSLEPRSSTKSKAPSSPSASAAGPSPTGIVATTLRS